MKRFFLKRILFVLLPATGFMPAIAQLPEVSVTLSNQHIVIGDQVPLTLKMQHMPQNGKVRWPSVPDSIKGWEVVDSGKIDTIRNAGMMALQQQLIITSFDSGSHNIPALEFRYAAGNRPEQSILSQPLSLMVNTIPVDTAQPFKPIKDIVAVEQPGFLNKAINLISSNKSLVLWVIFGLLILGALAYFLFYRKKTKDTPSRLETPYERSLRLLKELEAKQYYSQGKIKEHYSLLSDIIRTYLDERFGMSAMEQTTDELLASVKRNLDLRKVRPELKRLLRTADLAKFAKANPLPEEHKACFDAAFTIINKTKPVVTTPESDQ